MTFRLLSRKMLQTHTGQRNQRAFQSEISRISSSGGSQSPYLSWTELQSSADHQTDTGLTRTRFAESFTTNIPVSCLGHNGYPGIKPTKRWAHITFTSHLCLLMQIQQLQWLKQFHWCQKRRSLLKFCRTKGTTMHFSKVWHHPTKSEWAVCFCWRQHNDCSEDMEKHQNGR